MAGELKYMDDRIDEQNRGITMKSSSISLLAHYNQQDHLINLIDSPGHVEFGFEVSAALRLTDGALVVVDVLEGVSSQTYRVLLQTFEEQVASVLVLNKVDKLIRERQLSPLEAYRHLNQIIEQVNAILGSFINCRTIELSDAKINFRREKQYCIL
jgi:ribosome assembly protein 1